MTLTLLDIYNQTASQAWSMYDSDITADDELETGLKTSIQKALSEIWCSYEFPFRFKTWKFKTAPGKYQYQLPNGNLSKTTVNGKERFNITLDGNYLEYLSDYNNLEPKEGIPEGFYVHNDTLYLYPTPDKVYQIQAEYITLTVGVNSLNENIFTLNSITDTLNIPVKYEELFKNALITLSLAYSIADTTDENYSQYIMQYQNAYDKLIDYCKGIQVTKRKGWSW